MRNLKKVLSVLLVVAMIATAMVPAFAASDSSISADAKICADIGMILGEGAGVTPEYTATTLTRIQAAVMFLRLKGLAAEAAEFDGKDNFADVEDDDWFAPYTAYLKAHPELGFIGDGKNFDAENEISAQQYYKIVLTALGYEEGEGKDFLYADTIKFAEEKGLKKVDADKEALTVDDVCVATVEGLRAAVKGGTKTLATVLVEAGEIDADKAKAAGIYEEPAPVNALTEVSALTNALVKATFDVEVTGGISAAIVQKEDTTKTLEVKGIKYDGKDAYITTAEQAVGVPYTLTIKAGSKEFSKNFVGVPKDTTAPKLEGAFATNHIEVKLTFNEELDKESAQNISNYTIDNGLQVVKAVKDGKNVILTTSEQTQGTLYKLQVLNVKDMSGNLVDSDYKTAEFGGALKDTFGPRVTNFAVSSSGKFVTLEFDEVLDKASAENIANYTISGLQVLKAELIKKGGDDSDKNELKKVKLTTSAQKDGDMYKVVITNVKDKFGNVIDSDYDEVEFGGTAVDTIAPEADSFGVSKGGTKVEWNFKDNEAMDKDSAQNIANYKIDGLTVLKAEYDADAKKVTLTTSIQESGKMYKLVITNVKDEAGNAIKSGENEVEFGGTAEDKDAPKLVDATAIDKNTVEARFDEELDKETANDPTNYAFDGGLGYATKAEINKDDKKIVKLTTVDQVAGKSYKLTVRNVKDLVGNAIKSDADNTYTLGGAGNAFDLTPPEVRSIVGVDKHTFKITFSEKVKIVGSIADGDISVKEANRDAAFEGTFHDARLVDDNTALLVGYALGDSDKAFESKIYEVVINTDKIVDRSPYENKLKSDKNKGKFAGITTRNVEPSISAVVAKNKMEIEVIFSEKLDIGDANGKAISAFKEDAHNDFIVYEKNSETEVARGSDGIWVKDSNPTKALIRLDKALTPGAIYTFKLANPQDYPELLGRYSLDSKEKANERPFAAVSGDVGTPKISSLLATDKMTVKATFSTPVAISDLGSDLVSSLVLSNDTAYDGSLKIAELSSDGITLTLYFNKEFKVGSIYKIDLNENFIVDKFDDTKKMESKESEKRFAGSSTTNEVPAIASVTPKNHNTIEVVFTEDVYATDKVTDVDDLKDMFEIDNLKFVSVAGTITDGKLKDKKVTLTVEGTFKSKGTYDLKVVNSKRDYLTDKNAQIFKADNKVKFSALEGLTVSSATYTKSSGVLEIKFNVNVEKAEGAEASDIAKIFVINETTLEASKVEISGSVLKLTLTKGIVSGDLVVDKSLTKAEYEKLMIKGTEKSPVCVDANTKKAVTIK